MSAYRGGMPEAGFTGMLDSAAVPMILRAGRLASLPPVGRARPENRGPWSKASWAWPGRVFFRQPLGSSRSGEPNRTEKLSGGGGLGGDGTLPAQRPKLLLAGCGRRRSWGRGFGGDGTLPAQRPKLLLAGCGRRRSWGRRS